MTVWRMSACGWSSDFAPDKAASFEGPSPDFAQALDEESGEQVEEELELRRRRKKKAVRAAIIAAAATDAV